MAAVDWGIPEPKPSRGDDGEEGLRGLEWGAGQCEMDEVDATRHREVGPSLRQSGLIKGGTSGSGNGVNLSEYWEREFLHVQERYIRVPRDKVIREPSLQRGEEEQRGHLDRVKGYKPMSCHGGGRHV